MKAGHSDVVALVFAGVFAAAGGPPSTSWAAPDSAKLLLDADAVDESNGDNPAVVNGSIGPFNAPALVSISAWATTRYAAPAPAWFFTTISVGGKEVAEADSFRKDGISPPRMSANASYDFVLYEGHSVRLSVKTSSDGPGGKSIDNTRLRVGIRAIAISGPLAAEN